MDQPFTGLLPEEIGALVESEPSYRGKQIFSAVHNGAFSFNEITTLPKSLRGRLEQEFIFSITKLAGTMKDRDGTVKLQIGLEGALIEAVLLSDKEDRKTACLSTQAGCGMGCTFCRTGQLKLGRNLSGAEIVEQFHHLKNTLPKDSSISNIVFMGMGEPLENLEQVRRAVAIFHHPDGQNIGLRRITLSTCGLIRGIEDFIENGPDVRLAVSLNSADEQVRRNLMPVSRSNPLADLKKVLRIYQKERKKRITFEYVLLPGINDRKKDVDLLSAYLQGLSGVINLIPFNTVENTDYRSPRPEEVGRFLSLLEDAAIPVVQRYRKGRGINGACGQLGAFT